MLYTFHATAFPFLFRTISIYSVRILCPKILIFCLKRNIKIKTMKIFFSSGDNSFLD